MFWRSRHPFTLVIADDDPEFREMLAATVEQEDGFELAGPPGATSEEAVALALVHKPDAVILDWQMPLAGGFGAARKIRKEADGEIAIVILSDYDNIMHDVPNPDGAEIDALAAKGSYDWPRGFFEQVEHAIRLRRMRAFFIRPEYLIGIGVALGAALAFLYFIAFT